MKLRHPSLVRGRSDALTELLCAPSCVPENLDPSLRRVLSAKIAAKAPARSLGTLRLDSYTVLARDTASSSASSFLWTPRTARRLLGAAAARHVMEGRCLSPLIGVQREVADVIARSQKTHVRPGSLGAWLSEVPRGVLSAVLSEATNYATDLVTALKYQDLGNALTIGSADPIWAVPGAPWITLRARRDGEVTLDAERGTRALLCVRNGRPQPEARDDLSIVALVEALTHPDVPLPTRVVGLWPTCGKAVSLEVEAETMRHAARLVVTAVEARRQRPAVAA